MQRVSESIGAEIVIKERETLQISESFLSGDVLEMLKSQATASCFLCDLDEIDEEDWE